MAGEDNEKRADVPVGEAPRAADDQRADDSAPVPKLPRNRGIRFSGPELFRVVMTGAMLVVVLILAKPCGNAVSNFVMGFEGKNKGSAMPKPGNVDLPSLPGSAGDYVELHAGMTDEQVQQAIAQARAKHAAAAGSGSAASGSASSGSAGSGSATAGSASRATSSAGAGSAIGSAAQSPR